MTKIDLIKVKDLIKKYPYYWSQNKLFITTNENIIIVNDLKREVYDSIVFEYNKSENEKLEKKISNRKICRVPWEEWEVELLKKFKNNRILLQKFLSHRSWDSIKTKSGRLFNDN